MKAQALQTALGYHFAEQALLLQALTHRSHGQPHNERLEFIGDSVLNCVVARMLFHAFPSLDEGSLSRMRAGLVKQDTLHQIALGLDLGAQLQLGEGELKSGGHRRPSILADALEAIFGAALLDSGFEQAAAIVERLYAPRLAMLDPARAGKDPKTELQEWLQGRRYALPRYELAQINGEAHRQDFEVHCHIDGLKFRTVGCGASRRAAEQAAAQQALERIYADDRIA